MSTIGLPASSLQKAATYGIPSISSVSGGVTVANGTVTITSSYPDLPTVADPAFARANSAYTQANTATSLANQSITLVGQVNSYAQSAYFYANTLAGGSAIDNVARVNAQSAYNAANTVSNTTVYLQNINNVQNNNIIAINNYVASAYNQANSSLSSSGGTISSSLYITTSLGVGTAASGSTGEIRATGEITAYYSSDETLKENIVIIDNALDKLKQVRGVMYDWKDSVVQSRGGLDDYFVRKHDTGVIAQDVEKVLPEVVANRPDGTKAVRYEKLAGIIIQAINELAEQVEDIKKRIE